MDILNKALINKINKEVIKEKYRKYTYIDFFDNIKDYRYSIEIKDNQSFINKAAIVIDDEFNYDVVSLIYALSKESEIHLINKNNPNIRDIILENEIDVIFSKEKLNQSTLVVPIKNKRAIYKNIHLLYYRKRPYIINDKSIHIHNEIEEIISQEDLSDFNKILNETSIKNIFINSKMLDKLSILLIMYSINNGKKLNIIDSYVSEKNIDKILKYKPEIVVFDNDLLLQLYSNEKYRKIDFSFIKKIVLKIDEKNLELLSLVMTYHNINADIIEFKKQKVKKIEV